MASSDFHVGDLQGQIEEINEHMAPQVLTNYTLNSDIQSEGFTVTRVGNIVIIFGGLSSKTNNTVSFNHDNALVTGLPKPKSELHLMATSYQNSDPCYSYRLYVKQMTSSGELRAFWQTVVVPTSQFALYFNIIYATDE